MHNGRLIIMENIQSEITFVLSRLQKYDAYLRTAMQGNVRVIQELSNMANAPSVDYTIREKARDYCNKEYKDRLEPLLFDKETFMKDLTILSSYKDSLGHYRSQLHMFEEKFNNYTTVFQKQLDLVKVKKEIADRRERLDGVVAFKKISALIEKQLDMVRVIHSRLSTLVKD